MSSVVGSRYRIRETIGQGSFGVVSKGDDIKTGDPVAIKIESKHIKFPQLEFESNIYKKLSSGVNIPRFHFFTHNYSSGSALVIDLEGPSLENLLEKCGGSFSLKTVLMLVDQMLSTIEFVHKKGFIHRDIKPENFVIGKFEKDNQIFLIDFGLSKSYKLPDGSHIHFKDQIPLTGTARYASISSLSGNEQSRRDDMESLAYVWIYLLKKLPWINISAPTPKIKYDKILASKVVTPSDVLCSGLPQEFEDYLNLVKQLEFNEEPDYASYRKMFRDLFIKLNYTYDYNYDWSASKNKSKETINNQISNQKLVSHFNQIKSSMENREGNKNLNKKENSYTKDKSKSIARTNNISNIKAKSKSNARTNNTCRNGRSRISTASSNKKAGHRIDVIASSNWSNIPPRPKSAIKAKK